MTIWKILIVLGAIRGVVVLLQRLATNYPAVRRAFYHFGPRTDTRYMTRAELFKSSRAFLLWGVILAGSWIALMYLVSRLEKQTMGHPAALFLNFAVALLSGCGFMGSIWLFLSGVFRSPGYDPIAAYKDDMRRLEKEFEDEYGPPDQQP